MRRLCIADGCSKEAKHRPGRSPSQQPDTCSDACAQAVRDEKNRACNGGYLNRGSAGMEMGPIRAEQIMAGIPGRMRWLFDELPPGERRKVIEGRLGYGV